MISFRRILKFTVAAAVAFIMAGCSSDDALLASKGNMLPDNAMWAVKVNADQIWNKALGEPGSPAHNMWQTCKMMASMSTSELGEFGEVARQILNDPASLGVNMKEPLMLTFAGDLTEIYQDEVEGDVEMCLVALLDNKVAFLNVVDAAATLAKAESDVIVFKDVEREDYTHYELVTDEDVTIDLGVTNESAVLRFKYDTTEKILGLSDSMLALYAGDGPQDEEALETFYGSVADIAAWGDLDSMVSMAMPILAKEDPSVVAQLEAYLPMYAGATIVYDLDFQDGQTVLNANVYGSKELEDYAVKYYEKASDKFFKQLPESAFIAFNVALKDFAGLVDEMCAINPDYVEVLKYLEDDYGFNKELLKDFPGVITFVMGGEGINQLEPSFGLVMECKESVWAFVQESVLQGVESNENGVYNTGQVYVGYTDGYMFVKSSEIFNSQNSSSFADNAYAQIIANGGAVVNLEVIPIELLDYLASEIDIFMDGEDLLGYVTSLVVDTSDDFMSATVTLNMGDKNHNLLEKLVLTAVQSAF